MTLFLRCLAAGLLCVGLSTVQAAADDWVVREASGAVRVQQPGAASVALSATVLPLRPDRASIQQASLRDDSASLFLGDSLTPGAILTTGGDGRIVLGRGEQEIVIGPNARLSLPPDEADGFTRILQDAGAALFRVDRQDSQHFSVETPLLAAVVKGTTFTVSAAPDIQAVHVVEGLVEVRPLAGGAVELVPAGVTALIDAAAPATLHLEGAGGAAPGARSSSALLDGVSSSADSATWLVPSTIGGGPLDIDAATEGLMQGGIEPAAAARLAAPSDGAPAYANHANPGAGGLPPTAAAVAAEVSRVTRVADGGNGNANGLGGSNAGGNGNANGAGGSNAGSNGNANGAGGSNAGGNGNANGAGGSNAGGNGNANGAGGSNAGGNGNGNGA